MALLSEDTKDNLRLVWVSIMEGLYTFSPIQRVILIGAVVFIIPGYWLFRVGAKAGYAHAYKKYEVTATPSFVNPANLSLGRVAVLPVSGGYMGYAKVTNPNLEISATHARYKVRFLNSRGTQMYETTGTLYVPAAKDTTIVFPRFTTTDAVASAQLEVTNVQWQKKLALPKVDLNAPAPVPFEEAGGVRLEGVVTNNTGFKIGAVRVVVFVYNEHDEIVAVSERVESDLASRQRRAYVLHFPGMTKSQFNRIVPIVDTNTADSGNINLGDVPNAPGVSVPGGPGN